MRNVRYSLNFYLGLIIVSVVICVVTAYSTLSYFVARDDIVNEMKHDSEIALISLQKNIVSDIEAYAINEYEKLLLNEMHSEDVYAIIVSDNKMGVILGLETYITGKIRDADWNIIEYDHSSAQQRQLQKNCFLSLSAELVSDSGEALGTVRICNSDRAVQQALKESITANISYAVTISLLLIFLLLFAIRRNLLNPVSEIVSLLLKTDESGIPREKVSTDGPLEVGVLAHSINNMMDAIHKREASLDAALNSVRESENRYRSLIEHAADGIFIAGFDGRYQDVNSAGCRMLGFDRDEIVGKTILDLIPEEDVERLHDSKKEMVDGKTHISEWKLLTKDGSYLPVEVSANIMPNGQWQGFVRDISDRKQAEDKVRRFSQALEQSGEAIVITDTEGTIEHINPAYSKITGYSMDEALGKNPRMLRSGSQNARFYERMWKTLLKGEVWQGKVINRRRNGEQYPAMLTISPIKNEDGETVNYIGIQQNLEKFEELEAQFHQSQKMEAIGTLVGGIAHDFNNTLAGITGNLYLAKKASMALPEVVKRLESVEKLSFSAASTIQQLLAFSRKGIVQMNPISIDSFLKETIKLNEVSLPENIDFHVQVIDQNLKVKGDINQLQQVLLNLINNAFDAVQITDKPSIQIRLEHFVADASFYDSYEDAVDQEYALISVIDNGTGIADEHIEHLFEPFFTTKEPGKGTGLGLAMVYGSIKTHGGFLNVRSSQGADSGTVMEVYLPLLDSGDGVDIGEDSYEVIEGDGETILLVDDNLTVLETGKDVLEGMGYRVMTAEDGLDAVSLYQSRQDEIDMVILDVVMPKMGGPEALEEIKAINPDVKAMFATGYDKLSTQGVKKRQIKELVISKPFTVSKLSQTIREALK